MLYIVILCMHDNKSEIRQECVNIGRIPILGGSEIKHSIHQYFFFCCVRRLRLINIANIEVDCPEWSRQTQDLMESLSLYPNK